MDPLNGVTLFSGGGLVECALSTRYGGPVEFVGAVEMDPAIAAHYRLAHGDHCLTASVVDVDYRQWAGADYLHFSPPCTNASVANANAGETETDRLLAASCARAVREISPRIVTMENVSGYRDFESYEIITSALCRAGYSWHAAVYNAADFGTAQTRKRLILRAVKGAKVLPDVIQTHAEAGKAAGQTGDLFADSKFLMPWNGWYAAIEDLLPQCPDSQLAAWQIKRLPPNTPRPLLVGAQGYNGEVQHLAAEHPAFTPNTTSGAGAYRVLLDDRCVRLIERCLARFQGVPDAYPLPAKKSLAVKIIGNGVPVEMSRACCIPLMEGLL